MRRNYPIKQAVILAAGESSRFWPLNQKHKSLFKIMGRPLICGLIDGLEKSGVKEIIIVQSSKKDVETELKNYYFPSVKIKYVVQEKPLGTGDALLRARKMINGKFFVLNAERIDCGDYLESLAEKSEKERGKAILLSSPTEFPWLFGVLKVKGDSILDIVERPERGKEPSNLRNAAAYILPNNFFDYLEKVPTHPYSLIVALLKYAKEKGLKTIKLKKEAFCLKYPWDLLNVNEYLLKNIKTKISGKIEKNCHIKGSVIIEQGTIVRSGSYIEGPVYIGKNCQIGPNCYIKSFSSIGDNCRIGQAVEIKNSIVSQNTFIPHLSYVGDSVLGENCNLGAGTILANLRFDGKNVKALVKEKSIDTGRQKFGSVVGDRTKTGINVSIMPGVLIGSDCQIGPLSAVFENIKDNTAFYAKFERILKKRDGKIKN